ncbi:MAG TPA: FAD-binding protein [Caldithrix sp.]|nr:FAD-binding protein [Caldithrix sp.]
MGNLKNNNEGKIMLVGNSKFEEAITIAKKGSHCGMCRFDFLGTGVCPSGKKHGFLAYWPQGRMQIFKSLMSGKVKPTKKLIEITTSCSLCGICDKQCNFATQLRPEKVAKALKEYTESLDESDFQNIPEDENLKGLREIVGPEWATNDPIIISSYIGSIISPEAGLNFYIVMPKDAEELSKVIKFANTNNLPFLPRSGGTLLSMAAPTVLSNAFGLEQGIVIDLLRMKKLEIDSKTQTATVGAGITAFDLQKEAHKQKLRANVAEAGAHVCSNIASTGILSTWGNKYGWSADNFIDVETVDDTGNIRRHSDLEIKNPYTTEYGFTNISLTPPAIVTQATVKLNPVFDDEEAVFVPFENIKDALTLSFKIAKRGMGFSNVILSRKYLAEFISPTQGIAEDFEYILEKYMKLNYVVDIICNKDEKKIIESMVEYTIDKSTLTSLVLGCPKLATLKESEFMKILSEEKDPLKALFAGPMKKHFEKALDATPENISKIYDKDLQEFFKKVYSKPEMTNIVWLHEYRIFPSRLMRQRMFLPMGGVIWTAYEKNLLDWITMFEEVGEKNKLIHALGFISPFDQGKFAVLEYDFYYDHNDTDAKKRVDKAIIESQEKSLEIDGILSALNFYFKGLYRKEHILFPIPKAISSDDLELFRELLTNIIGEG